MTAKRREFYWVMNALILLATVSLYRRLSMRFLAADAVRPYIVYAVYLALTALWAVSIKLRITQENMRLFLLLEDGVMLLWLTVRFVQDAFLYRNVYLMRISGYFIAIPAALIPLFGLYAAFGLGRADDYRFAKKWYLLLFPAAVIAAMALTNEYHHFVFYVIPDEPQPNLYFHPYIGIYIMYAWALALVSARVVVIRKRNGPAGGRAAALAPYFEPAALLLFCAPYSLSSFWVDAELIEFSAGVFFIEAASWEIFIYMGLVPVNTQYKKVFYRSTVAMQILSADGRPLARSGCAPELSAETFEELRLRSVVPTEDGKELQLFRISGGYLVWQKDVSEIRAAIGELRRTASELQQESSLLGQELKLRSEEAAIREQNRIYNQLTGEVGGQLALLRNLLLKKDAAADKAALFREICLIGTYVKRRCNLRLTEQSDGVVPSEDLELSFRDLTGCLADMGCAVSLRWSGAPLPSPGFALLALDVFEHLLECARFRVTRAAVEYGADSSFSVLIGPAPVPSAALRLMEKDGCRLSWETSGDGCLVILRHGGAEAC